MVLTTSATAARVLGALRLAIVLAVVAVVGHDAVFASRYGFGRELSQALRRSGHDGWWGVLGLTVVAVSGVVLAVQLIRIGLLARRARSARRPRRRRAELSRETGYVREWLGLWSLLLPAAAATFAVQEDLEHRAAGVAGHGLAALSGPEHPLAIPVLTIVAGAVAAIAALIRWRVRTLERVVAAACPSAPRRRIPLVPRPAASAELPRPRLGTLGLAFDAGRAPPEAA